MKATTDAAWYAERGVSTIVYGAGDLANAHRPDEWVPLAEVVTPAACCWSWPAPSPADQRSSETWPSNDSSQGPPHARKPPST